MKFKKDSIHKENEDKINAVRITSGKIDPTTLRQKILNGHLTQESIAAMIQTVTSNKGK